MSTRKLLRDVRRMAEGADMTWAGHEIQGNDHIRVMCIARDGRLLSATMSATPRSPETALRKTISRLRRLKGDLT